MWEHWVSAVNTKSFKEKNNKLCSQNMVSVLRVSLYLCFFSFSSVLRPTPQPLCSESSWSLYFQRLNYAGTPWWKLQMFFHHFSLSAGTAWPLPAVHSSPLHPSLPHSLSLHPLPLIHLLPPCRVLFLALPICRSYCVAISDCDEIMGKWTCLCNPLTMSWEREMKNKYLSVTERISESIVLYNCLFLVITANTSERSSAGDERFPFEWSSNNTHCKHVNITGETRFCIRWKQTWKEMIRKKYSFS